MLSRILPSLKRILRNCESMQCKQRVTIVAPFIAIAINVCLKVTYLFLRSDTRIPTAISLGCKQISVDDHIKFPSRLFDGATYGTKLMERNNRTLL